jgi:hypothetical protein
MIWFVFSLPPECACKDPQPSLKLGAAALLDPSFQPAQDNAGTKDFQFLAEFIDNQLSSFEAQPEQEIHNLRSVRSKNVQNIIKFIAEILGGEPVHDYFEHFFNEYMPAIDSQEGNVVDDGEE